ncbi:hypothetical protein MAR_017072 [Mya arenaria]|uniref:Uncharacterized protein n=1 Tax=Mya arenaria TaxID=6604 RepID=A0ABY7EFB4_MYAAR|nr:hypothetical protein MAR_017072 [Mya arenaria]
MNVYLVLLVFAVVLNTGESRFVKKFQDNSWQGDETKEESEIESLSPYSPPELTTAELEKNNWEMIFRATAGNGQNTYDAWTTGAKTTASKPVNMKRSLDSHFRDPGVAQWTSNGITYVKFALYKDNREVANVIFDARGSTSTNWFSSSKVVDSSWTDLMSTGSYRIFSVAGHTNSQTERRFHIATQQGGCDNDRGFVASIEHNDCDWDNHPSYPQFIYSDIDSDDVFQRRQFGRADYLAVFVFRY